MLHETIVLLMALILIISETSTISKFFKNYTFISRKHVAQNFHLFSRVMFCITSDQFAGFFMKHYLKRKFLKNFFQFKIFLEMRVNDLFRK